MTTPPLTPAAGDLRDFPHTPVYRARLFASEFHAQATDAEWRAGLTLWVKSWDQVPAGSLPVDDVSLCRLAELGRDLKSWKKIKDGAMRGWILCTDGRMYHPTVAEGVNHALDAKVAQRNKTSAARIAALQKKLTASTDMEEKQRLQSEIEKVQQTLKQALSLNEKPSVTDPPKPPVTDLVTDSKEKVREGEGKEKGFDLVNTPLTPQGGKRVRPPKSGNADPEGFEDWYALYRRKDARADAVKAWQQKELDRDEVRRANAMAAVKAWRWAEDKSKIPLPASWLRGERWNDEAVSRAVAMALKAQAGTGDSGSQSSAPWWTAAGFEHPDEAANFGCREWNAKEFRDGKRVTAEAAA